MARPPRQLTRSTGTVTVEVQGASDVHKMLERWADAAKMDARTRIANREAGKVLARALRPEVGKSSRRMRKAVYYHNQRGSKTGVIVGHHKRVSSGPKGDFWPMVVGGTRDHGPRKARALAFEGRDGFVMTSRVKGVAGTDAVRKVAEGPAGASAMDKMMETLAKE